MAETVDYDEIASDAAEIIEGAGTEVSLIRLGKTVSDSDKPWLGTDTADVSDTTLAGVKAVVYPIEVTRPVDGSSTPVERVTALIAESLIVEAYADHFDIREANQLVFDGRTYQVLSARIIAPGGTDIVYQIDAETK